MFSYHWVIFHIKSLNILKSLQLSISNYTALHQDAPLHLKINPQFWKCTLYKLGNCKEGDTKACKGFEGDVFLLKLNQKSIIVKPWSYYSSIVKPWS